MDQPKIFHVFGFVVWTSLWFSVVYFSFKFLLIWWDQHVQNITNNSIFSKCNKNWQNLGWKNWFYCKLLMTFCCWFCAKCISVLLGEAIFGLVSLMHSILFSLPQPSKTDCFTIINRDRMTICSVYFYNNLSAKMQGLF